MRLNIKIACPKCKGCAAMRINRSGFLQRKVLGLVGIYPWKCGACGSVFLWPQRVSRHADNSFPSDPHNDPATHEACVGSRIHSNG
jgi:hypothetical protein